jgi:glycogen(starch) synthase
MTSERLHVILPTDVFPPRCGGAGWSAHALARALLARGHAVTAVVPALGAPGVRREEVLGVPTVRYGYRAPRLPFVRNYARHERLWPGLATLLAELATTPGQAIIHAQHVQTAPAAVLAGRRIGAPVVVTVRDHWPWDYFATGLHGDRVPYGRQGLAALATDLPARLGPARGAAALPAALYMLAHLRRRQAFLRQADAVIAVSGYIAGRLDGIVAPERVHVIPNMVDLAAIDQIVVAPPASVAPDERYLLFVGKLERNKGAHLLPEVLRAPGAPPLLVAGEGPLRSELERALGARARVLGGVDHDEALRLMAHCTLLLFPSTWGEPLSRVLLEAAACAAPILAMPTGGTGDIIADGVSGALEPTPERFARRLAQLLARPDERAALGAGARRVVAVRFAEEVVAPQIEALYRELRAAR